MIKTKIIASLFIISILISSGLTYHFAKASFTGNLEDLPFYVGAPTPYSYLITTNGTHYFAFNGTTGEMSWESTNSSYVIQSALDAGINVRLLDGIFDLGTTQLIIDNHGQTLEGISTDLLGSVGTILNYSGTNDGAIRIYNSGTRLQRVTISNLHIQAEGDAITDSSNSGIFATDIESLQIDCVVINDFEAGSGIKITATSSSYSVDLDINHVLLNENKYGINIDGYDASHESNTLWLSDSIILGKTPVISGSCGLIIGVYSTCNGITNVDIEGFEVAIYSAGDYTTFLNTRSENCTTHITFTSYAESNRVYDHTFVGGTTQVSQSGTDNTLHNCKGYLTYYSEKDINFSNGGYYEHHMPNVPTKITLNAYSSDGVWITAVNATHYQVGVGGDGSTYGEAEFRYQP